MRRSAARATSRASFHAVAAPHAWGRLFDKMRETARARGCIGAHGPLKRADDGARLRGRGVFFYYAGGSLLYSNRDDIRRAVESGERCSAASPATAGRSWPPTVSARSQSGGNCGFRD